MIPLFLYPMFFLTFLCLGYYVYQDYKYREINILPMFILSVFAFIYNLIFFIKLGVWQSYFLQIILTSIFVGIIFVLGKITVFAYIGEGDLLAIIFISITTGITILFAPFVFLGALICVLFVPIMLFLYNLFAKNSADYNFGNNFLLMFLGYPATISKINKFHTPLEKIKEKNGKIYKVVNFIPNTDPKLEIYELKKVAKINNIKKIWVSPLIPFIVPIFISYLIIFVLSFFDWFSYFGKFAILYI